MKLSTVEKRVLDFRLQIHQPHCSVHRIGHTGPVVDWHIHHPDALRKILKHPAANLGKTYVRGDWDVDTRRLARLIQVLVPRQGGSHWLYNRSRLHRLRARLPHAKQRKTQPQWQDTSLWVSRLCLGEELFQACALYSEPGMTLEQAQRMRCRRLLDQLQLQPGQQVLDLNAGWGALALYLASHAEIRVTAIVRSREQLQFAQSETRRRGLEGQVHFRLSSYHQCRGHFDRIVACGFLEQYPEPAYPALFQHIEELLEDDGLAWIQVNGRGRNIALSNRWLQNQLPSRHSLPRIPDLVTALESTALRTLTLKDQTGHWLQDLDNRMQRFHRHRSAFSQRFGEQRTRYWEFLLASQLAATDWQQLSHYEVMLGNKRSAWSERDSTEHTPIEELTSDIVSGIPGLARDI